jgi:hypothetical protein
MPREDLEGKNCFDTGKNKGLDFCYDIPHPIHSQKNSDGEFFIKRPEIHNAVNMPLKLGYCNTFAVDYPGVNCG